MWVKGEIFRDLADPQIEARGGLDRTAQLSIFDRLEWFQRTWAHCPVPGTPLIVRARADGADAWLFLVETAPGRATGLDGSSFVRLQRSSRAARLTRPPVQCPGTAGSHWTAAWWRRRSPFVVCVVCQEAGHEKPTAQPIPGHYAD